MTTLYDEIIASNESEIFASIKTPLLGEVPLSFRYSPGQPSTFWSAAVPPEVWVDVAACFSVYIDRSTTRDLLILCFDKNLVLSNGEIYRKDCVPKKTRIQAILDGNV